MSNADRFDPIQTSRVIERSYRDYLSTTIHFDREDFQTQLEGILAKPTYLAKGPFLEAAPPYTKGRTVRQLVDEGVLCEAMLHLGDFDPDRPLYAHQERAIRRARAGHNYIVTTGTGSGKTECFLLPMIDDILRELGGEREPGIRAIIMYPMNALANDQLKRLRSLLRDTPITFGRYTGDTPTKQSEAEAKWYEEQGDVPIPANELISREVMRETPPNILLTNYSMLEYLLLRPADAPLFESAFGAHWRHMAIDEAHVYSGALGTEIAYLLRRLKARIEAETGERPRPHCYATSATMGTREDLPRVAAFAEDLFGEPFATEGDVDVITSSVDSPVDSLREPWGMLPLEDWPRMGDALQGAEPAKVLAAILSADVPASELDAFEDADDMLLGLGHLLLGERSTATLVRAMSQRPLDLTQGDSVSRLGISGLDAATLAAMVEVLSQAQRSEDVAVLSSRYHSFLRGPEGIFVNLATGKLRENRATSEACDAQGNANPVYELAVCRHCGEAYILGQEKPLKDHNCSVLDPKHEGSDDDDSYVPHSYYRILSSEDDLDENETLYWLCGHCGTLHTERKGGEHAFTHAEADRIPIAFGQATEDVARCNHCGYRNIHAIQPMRVSPESVGSVVCYDLVRQVPPFETEDGDDAGEGLFDFVEAEPAQRAGSVICFSDNRQDAAYFAPAMERTYNRITIRQVIREAVSATSQGSLGTSPSTVCEWIATEGFDRYSRLFGDKDPRHLAQAWVLNELMAEDSRNSLEGLGVIRVEPTAFVRGLENPKVGGRAIARTLGRLPKGVAPWMEPHDLVILTRMCLETLREQNALVIPVGVDAYLGDLRKSRPRFVTMGDKAASKDSIVYAGQAKRTENKRSNFIRRYAHAVHGAEMSREEAVTLLEALYGFTYEYLVYLNKKTRGVLNARTKTRFRLGMNLWTLYPQRGEDVTWRCDTCGCETHYDTGGVCPTYRCTGKLHKLTVSEALSKDAFYKQIYSGEALPLRIEEHTAQLSRERASEIQQDFLKGEVNVLSCTTTFELGVDVGDLRAVFMRNVPPSTANYVQRAGRVGRRAGMPGFALTFARLRSHDIALYKDPERLISGRTSVPSCYLDNAAIALRHVFAIAFSEFFRQARREGKDYAHAYDRFMSLEEERPEGLDFLRGYLERRPPALGAQVTAVMGDGTAVAETLGLEGWDWVRRLVGEPDGRLIRAHELKHEDYQRLSDGVDRYMRDKPGYSAALSKARQHLCKEPTITVLAENGILPKYGFPTDLVELHIRDQERSIEPGHLQLQRGLRQAIREYAPGNEVIADKKVWRSIGIRKPKGRELVTRYYGTCNRCGTFMLPIDDFSQSAMCPVCEQMVPLKKRMLIPSEGFVAAGVRKDPGEKRPRSRGVTRIEFCQQWPEQVKPLSLSYAGGKLVTRYASNGRLCAMNLGGAGGFVWVSVLHLLWSRRARGERSRAL